MTGGLHGRDVTGNAFCEWLLPIHLDATAEPDRRRAATCQAGTGRTTGHLLAHPDSDAKKPRSRC